MEALRHTPAGIPVLAFKISHASEQVEDGRKRQVQCEISAIAIGAVASRAALRIGDSVTLEGFLARKGLRSQQPVLHVNRIESLSN